MRRKLKHPVTCPNCFALQPLVRQVSGIDRGGPRDGDVSLCITCGELMMFDSQWKGGARQPTLDEEQELAANAMVQMAQRAWKAVTS